MAAALAPARCPQAKFVRGAEPPPGPEFQMKLQALQQARSRAKTGKKRTRGASPGIETTAAAPAEPASSSEQEEASRPKKKARHGR
eukprot:4645841-Prymnesium_polylepis.1